MGPMFVFSLMLSVMTVREQHGSSILINILPWVKLILACLKLDGFETSGTLLVWWKQMLQLFWWDMHTINLRDVNMSLLLVMEDALILW
jgi:hypothetical protein